MTPQTPSPAPSPLPSPNTPLRDDESIRRAVEALVAPAADRRLWFLFLDAERRILQPLIPIEDYPESPDTVEEVPDLGRVTGGELFMERGLSLSKMLGAAHLILAWERTGGERFLPGDLAWARASARAATRIGLPIVAQLVVHDGGARTLTADDYA